MNKHVSYALTLEHQQRNLRNILSMFAYQPRLYRGLIHCVKRSLKTWKKRMPIDLTTCRSDPVITTINTPEFRSIFTPELEELIKLFKKYNYDLRVAGGAVRDILMGKQPTDLDFASDATPDQMVDMFTQENVRMINNNGLKHGTVTPRINDAMNFEVTTLRVDVETNGRHAKVQFTTDWKQDAGRRDLTINSMYLDFEGKVYDYFYGYDDLQKRRIVFVGHPEDRIREDYLRILRYFRFYGRIADHPDKHDENTLKAITNNASGLEDISGERIWKEWALILTGRFNEEMTLKMLECGVGRYMGLPETTKNDHFIEICQRCKNENITLESISYATALLFSINDLENLTKRLKISRYHQDLSAFILENRDEKFDNENLTYYLKTIVTSGKQEVLKKIIIETLRYKGKSDIMKQLEDFSIPKFPVDGRLLSDYTNEPKNYGLIIKRLRGIWAESLCQTDCKDLLKEVPQIIDDIENRRK